MELLKQLRERSGAGMMDCKKALDEANGDIELAIEILRKKGIAKAAKREGREAHEGIIAIAVNDAGDEGYMVEVNSETDFVSKNEKFQNFAKEVLEIIKTKKPAVLEDLLALPMGAGTVKDAIDSLSGIIGEKLSIKRLAVISGQTVAGYSHLGGKIGVLIALDQAGKNDLATDLAMQIAAANPRFIDPSQVPAEEIAKEKEIEAEALAKEGKPAEVIEKILVGKINKFYEGVCLTKQECIKNDKQKVEQVLGDAKILGFSRFSLE